MPLRKTPLVTDYYYHVLNRSVGGVPIFTHQREYNRAKELIYYYRFKKATLSFSRFNRLNQSQKEEVLGGFKKGGLSVEIICFCLMPTHFHFLVKQTSRDGIINFIRRFQNSYARYFNFRHQRQGPLFQNRFKAILIEDNSQLLHLSRYIHLNPYASFLIKTKKDLLNYPWSSLPEYLGKRKGFCQPAIVLNQFKNPDAYQDFVFDRADYQRQLEKIKHLILE